MYPGGFARWRSLWLFLAMPMVYPPPYGYTLWVPQVMMVMVSMLMAVVMMMTTVSTAIPHNDDDNDDCSQTANSIHNEIGVLQVGEATFCETPWG